MYNSQCECLLVGRAIEFGKPIIIVVETDRRFFAWDNERWRRDECTRRQGTSNWSVGWLQNKFADVQSDHPNVVKLIDAHLTAGLMIPYRRREFQAHAMARELVRRASTTASWGAVMPQPCAEHRANLRADRTVRIIADTATAAVGALVAELSAVLVLLSPRLSFEPSIETASHVLVVIRRLYPLAVSRVGLRHHPTDTHSDDLCGEAYMDGRRMGEEECRGRTACTASRICNAKWCKGREGHYLVRVPPPLFTSPRTTGRETRIDQGAVLPSIFFYFVFFVLLARLPTLAAHPTRPHPPHTQ